MLTRVLQRAIWIPRGHEGVRAGFNMKHWGWSFCTDIIFSPGSIISQWHSSEIPSFSRPILVLQCLSQISLIFTIWLFLVQCSANPAVLKDQRIVLNSWGSKAWPSRARENYCQWRIIERRLLEQRVSPIISLTVLVRKRWNRHRIIMVKDALILVLLCIWNVHVAIRHTSKYQAWVCWTSTKAMEA